MFIKREKKEDCLIAGFVIGDQKQKEYNGKSYIEFGISMGKDESGENLPIVNVTIWERAIPTVNKGDRVLAAGRLRTTEKDGKTYYSLTADFCTKEQTVSSVEKVLNQHPELTPIEDDDTLPF